VLREVQLSGDELAVERRKIHDAKVVLVGRGGDFSTNFHLAVELFYNFTLKGFPRSFARLDLSARELPHAPESAILAALGTENQSLSLNYCANYVDLLRHDYLTSSVPV
jgi:hypothetical protein